MFDLRHRKRSERYELTVSLTPDGQSKCCRADTKPRMIDLRNGNFLIHTGTSCLVKDVRADSDVVVEAGYTVTEEYEVRES